MKKGKNFNLFLIDGEITGRIKCTMLNWTGIAYKIPRSFLDSSKERDDLKQSGVYFLFGQDDNGDDAVYIGQAGIRKNGEGILFRVSEHIRDSFYFSETVMLTTQNNSFGPTEISYLENRFRNMALEADRYKVVNGNEPNPGNITEEKESELEDFIEYSKLTLGVLGYKIFSPLIDKSDETEQEKILYISKTSRDKLRKIQAKCKVTAEGFVVLKNSDIENTETNSVPSFVKRMRDEAIEEGDIRGGKLVKDYLFSSPSSAASFVLGRSVSGYAEWKNSDGTKLKDIENI